MRVRRLGANWLSRMAWSEKHFGYVRYCARARLVLVTVRGLSGRRAPRFARVWRRDDWRRGEW
jgi:hypothetical protein